ncbi:lysyl oxidase homolog 2-like [Mytilus californianus]|uniref:lysyl oxidase homolog 2-like n=1 Tax=Mytilus californianus TaxID=6549 RepID=UPI002247CB61|nr:lysyl oxidase homolog 2-like [Mytilus californianus]
MYWTIIFYFFFYISTRFVADASNVRLASGKSFHENGADVYEGRLEVFYNNSWGIVCDDAFNKSAAIVVCRMLGFYGNAMVLLSYRNGSRRITLDNVGCNGLETDIMDCTHAPWGIHDCQHTEDVGVRCEQKWRLRKAMEGVVVEFKTSNSYIQVCNRNFDDEKVCQLIGLESHDFVVDVTSSTSKSQDFVDLNCTGTEELISQCKATNHLLSECKTGMTIFKCLHQRLIHGTTSYNGRLELHHDGKWGTVCDDGFGDNEASVVCRYSGLSWNGRFTHEFKYWQSNSTYLLDDVVCTGRESSIENCRHTSWNLHNCDNTHRDWHSMLTR